MVWLTFAESRRQPETQKILKGHNTDKKTTASGPDLSNCFSPLKMQQINQPEDTDEGVEVQAPPCDIDGGHKIPLQSRAEEARWVSMNIHKWKSGGVGQDRPPPSLGPEGSWGSRKVGRWVRSSVFALVLLQSTPQPRNSLQPFDVLANWINHMTQCVRDRPERTRSRIRQLCYKEGKAKGRGC